jgi:hypothetical protein
VGDWSPLEDDVLLTGLITVVVRQSNGRPARVKSVKVLGCGFI